MFGPTQVFSPAIRSFPRVGPALRRGACLDPKGQRPVGIAPAKFGTRSVAGFFPWNK
jgi:hypothetical protein